jgi:adenylate cyclase class 2
MPQETEIKLYIKDLKLHRTLKRLGVQPVSPKTPRVHESNLLFDTPQGGLAKHGQLLRIRTETAASANKRPSANSPERHLLTFKSPPESLAMEPRLRTSFPNGNPPQVIAIKSARKPNSSSRTPQHSRKYSRASACTAGSRYEKYRTTYKTRSFRMGTGLLIEIDETPIGTFLELEGPSGAIERVARELGFSPADFIVKNYLVLFLDNCKKRGQSPTNMLFKP